MQLELRGHLFLSVKAAIAASVAWLLVKPLWGIADQWPYYAPLGAVIAVTSTVAGSVRSSLQSLAAILAGAVIAMTARFVDHVPIVVELAIVVAAGTGLAAWRVFGASAAWVPISGMFILIIGRGDPLDYAAAYLGLTSLGAAIGIAVNIAFPPLALQPMTDSIARLREVLAGQLDDLADGLRYDEPPSQDEWEKLQRSIRPTTEDMQRVVDHSNEGRRANWRARRWNAEAQQRYEQARALQQVSFLIEDLTALLVDQEHREREKVALGPELRPHAAKVLQTLAEMLRSVEGQTAEVDKLRDADAAVVHLGEAIRDVRHRDSEDLFAAGTIVSGARRTLASLVPEDCRSELPSNW